jgi:hemoglobin-like flavoprotein
LSAAFLDRLFRHRPELCPDTPVAMAVQRATFVSTISAVMAHLDRPDVVRSLVACAARALALRGVEHDDYPRGARALRAAFAEVLGHAYTAEHDAALETLTTEAIRTMLGAATSATAET